MVASAVQRAAAAVSSVEKFANAQEAAAVPRPTRLSVAS